MVGGGEVPIPSFMNHLESGTLLLESGASTWISLQSITDPKGILFYSNDFDVTSAKADKSLLGAFSALYIRGKEVEIQSGTNYLSLFNSSSYMVNWGSGANNANSVPRNTRTESRGVAYFDSVNKRMYIHGFGTGEYDFKYNVQYNWIAWD